MSNSNKLSFFEKLRKGVNNIETEVKQLKQTVENDSNELTENDLREAKLFDRDLRQLYVSYIHINYLIIHLIHR